jgi:hypothetical protein
LESFKHSVTLSTLEYPTPGMFTIKGCLTFCVGPLKYNPAAKDKAIEIETEAM